MFYSLSSIIARHRSSSSKVFFMIWCHEKSYFWQKIKTFIGSFTNYNFMDLYVIKSSLFTAKGQTDRCEWG